MYYIKKAIPVKAFAWFKNGDHPEDGTEGEGKVVRYYRRPDKAGGEYCAQCGFLFHDHGWIDTLEGGHIVCPGDFIITGIKGEHYPCKPDIFFESYVEYDSEKAGVSPDVSNIENVRDIVRQWLKDNGYDGLYSDECGCELKDLMPCDDGFLHCSPGFKCAARANDPEGFDFYIVASRKACEEYHAGEGDHELL